MSGLRGVGKKRWRPGSALRNYPATHRTERVVAMPVLLMRALLLPAYRTYVSLLLLGVEDQ